MIIIMRPGQAKRKANGLSVTSPTARKASTLRAFHCYPWPESEEIRKWSF